MKHRSNACDLCGRVLGPAHMPRHRGSRPCRAKQIEDRMAERGLVPMRSLGFQWAVRKAGVRFERFPASSKSDYRQARLWTRGGEPLPRDHYDDRKLHKDLGDRLFVEEWTRDLLRSSNDGVGISSDRIVGVLRAVAERGEDFRRALSTAKALGGGRAVNAMLAAAGIVPDYGIDPNQPWRRKRR